VAVAQLDRKFILIDNNHDLIQVMRIRLDAASIDYCGVVQQTTFTKVRGTYHRLLLDYIQEIVVGCSMQVLGSYLRLLITI